MVPWWWIVATFVVAFVIGTRFGRFVVRRRCFAAARLAIEAAVEHSGLRSRVPGDVRRRLAFDAAAEALRTPWL